MWQVTFKNKVPSYRIKNVKGSGYLYKKSELSKLKEIQITANTEFINLFVGNEIIKKLFFDVLAEINDGKHSQDYDIACKFFLDRLPMKEISKREGITIEAIRQRLLRVIQRMRTTSYYSPKAYIELQRKINSQEAEIRLLKQLLVVKNKDDDGLNESKTHISKIVNYLAKPISEFDLSTRALNGLSAVGVRTMYDLAVFCFGDDFQNLSNTKNIGPKSIFEAMDILEEYRKQISSETGVDLKELVKSEILNKDNQVHLNILREVQVQLNVPISSV